MLADFLHTCFYPEVASNWEYTESRQDVGEDLTAAFNHLDESVVVDEKAQNSDRYLNNPSPTFVMEIFSDTWWDSGEPKGSIGWFVNQKIETEYYVLVWLPDVSTYKLSGSGTHLHYRPASVLQQAFDKKSSHNDFSQIETDPPEYRAELQADKYKTFDQLPGAVPDRIQDGSATLGDSYYEKEHIFEAKIAVIEKQKIVEKFEEEGLTQEVLLEKGREAIRKKEVKIGSSDILKIMRSGDTESGSGDGENPVNAVVPYSTYHGIADRTYHYRQGVLREGERLFHF